MGTLGAGNHYAEIQVVEEVFDKSAARKMGIDKVGQVCIMIHSGSRGLGHQVNCPINPLLCPRPAILQRAAMCPCVAAPKQLIDTALDAGRFLLTLFAFELHVPMKFGALAVDINTTNLSWCLACSWLQLCKPSTAHWVPAECMQLLCISL